MSNRCKFCHKCSCTNSDSSKRSISISINIINNMINSNSISSINQRYCISNLLQAILFARICLIRVILVIIVIGMVEVEVMWLSLLLLDFILIRTCTHRHTTCLRDISRIPATSPRLTAVTTTTTPIPIVDSEPAPDFLQRSLLPPPQFQFQSQS